MLSFDPGQIEGFSCFLALSHAFSRRLTPLLIRLRRLNFMLWTLQRVVGAENMAIILSGVGAP
jgi:hypothetical protein